jgi:F-type H+-transporting ATPase subunit b
MSFLRAHWMLTACIVVALCLGNTLACGAEPKNAESDPSHHGKAAAAHHGKDTSHGHGEVEDLVHGNAGEDLEKPEEFKSDLAIYTFVVFLLLLAVLWKFAWGPISDGLERREQAIADNIATAENAAEDARRLTDRYEAKLAGAAEDVKKIVDSARREAEVNAQRIIDKAQVKASEEGDRMLHEVETAKEAALKEISDRASDLAIDLAGQIVGRELSPSDHERLIEQAQADFVAADSKAT